LVMISTEDPIPIRQRKPEIPEGLARVIHQALSREVKDRFKDVDEFRRVLKEWV
jgi:hypothetical protein